MKIIFLFCFKLQQKIPGGRLTIHSSIRVWRIPWTEEPGGLYSPWGHKESDMNEETKHAHNISQAKRHTNQHNDSSKPDLKGHKEGGGTLNNILNSLKNISHGRRKNFPILRLSKNYGNLKRTTLHVDTATPFLTNSLNIFPTLSVVLQTLHLQTNLI